MKHGAIWLAASLVAGMSGMICPAMGQSDFRNAVPAPANQPSYADLAGLADSAAVVARAEVRKLVQLESQRAPGVRPGWGRFFVEAKTKAVLAGHSGLTETVRYLVDLPLDQAGKPPKLKKQQVLLVVSALTGRPGELQLAAPDSQLLWSAETEARLRAILAELNRPGAPARVTGVREAIFVPGTLRGEGETQIFLNTANDSAAMITVMRRPDAKPVWAATFSEVLDAGLMEGGQGVPAPGTLAWFRLACTLPPILPARANLSQTPADRAQAEADYRLVMTQLGPCQRNRR